MKNDEYVKRLEALYVIAVVDRDVPMATELCERIKLATEPVDVSGI